MGFNLKDLNRSNKEMSDEINLYLQQKQQELEEIEEHKENTEIKSEKPKKKSIFNYFKINK